MTSALTNEPNPPGPPPSEAAVSINVSETDLQRLQALAAAAGVGEPGARSFAELLSSALRHGIDESYKSAGLAGPREPVPPDLDSSRRDDEPAAGGPSPLPGHQTSRLVAFGAAAVATVVLIVGSYAGHWTWTGLTANGQVWDWMQLLLLPVALGTFPLWLRFSWEMTPRRRKALGAAVVAFVVFALVGYLVPLTWTGFRGHTLWNWLTLIVLPVTITTAAVWSKTGRRLTPTYRAAAVALGAAWIVTVIGGYAAKWEWTGYPGNTLWEWVQLLLAPIAITTFVVPELIKLVAGKAADSGQA